MTILVAVGIAILLGLAIFQAFLIAGRPLGQYAWGGQHTVLPRHLRIASAVSIILYVLFGALLVSKAGLLAIIPEGRFLTVAMWVVTSYFALGIIMNVISRSKKERMVMTPVAIALFVVFLLVTLG